MMLPQAGEPARFAIVRRIPAWDVRSADALELHERLIVDDAVHDHHRRQYSRNIGPRLPPSFLVGEAWANFGNGEKVFALLPSALTQISGRSPNPTVVGKGSVFTGPPSALVVVVDDDSENDVVVRLTHVVDLADS